LILWIHLLSTTSANCSENTLSFSLAHLSIHLLRYRRSVSQGQIA
jgi:hypothetical protein